MVRGKLGVLLILSSLVLCQAVDMLTPGCIDYPNPIENSYGVEVNCNRVKSSHKFYKRCNHSKAKKSAPFILDFKCAVENDQCLKVRHSLDTAFELITNVIVLEEPVTVNVSFVSFCKELNIGCGDFGAAGAANPARSIPHVDSDGVTRMYPQALIKQMKLKEHPEYSSSDINAFFNSDANFWFMEDGHYINPNQNDFLYAITHELFHGLGITTNWVQYFNPATQGFTPYPRFTRDEDNKLVFHGFIEAAFDRYLIEANTSRPISQYAKALNSFIAPGTSFNSEAEFISAFNQSRQYSVALHFEKLATTKGAVTFKVGKKVDSANDIVLETSLNPFIPGSGLTHFDYATYSNTSDFLMRFTQLFGESILGDVDAGGQYIAGPIGPRLTEMMHTLGYRINPKPESWIDILRRRYPTKN